MRSPPRVSKPVAAVSALAILGGGWLAPGQATGQESCLSTGQAGECHFDKIIFRPTDMLKWDCPADFMDPPDPLSTNPRTGLVRLTDADWLDIKVPDDPRRVADVKQKVIEFLADRDCTRANGERILKPHVTIIDVEYAVFTVRIPVLEN